MTLTYSLWSEERVELLKKLWAEGLSASQIAYRLGNCSRNAVLGKLFRIGFAVKRPTTSRKKPEPRVNKNKRLVAPIRVPRATLELMAQFPLPPAAETDIPRKTLLELEPGECRFIPFEPKGRCYCAAPSVPGLPYCAAHAARCLVLTIPKRVKAPAVVEPEKQEA